MRPFGCPVTILNTLDHIGKFDGKADEGFFVGYSTNSKAFRVFNSRTRIVEENLHVKFSEETPNIVENGPNWLFDIDALTISMNYKPVVGGNQTNDNAGTKENIDAGQAGKKIDSPDVGFKSSGKEEKMDSEHPKNKDKNNVVDENIVYGCIDDPSMPNLEEIVYSDDDDDEEEVGVEADMNNLATTVPVSPIPTIRAHKDHPLEKIIRDIHSAPQTRRMTKNVTEHVEPKKVIQALTDPSRIEAMQDELLQFKLQKVWILVDLPYGKKAIGTKWVYINKKDDRGIVVRNKARLLAQGYTQEEGIDYDEFFAPVSRIKVIRFFLAYASFMNFIVYQMDVQSAFLYGTIKEEVYVCQPLGFEDPEFPNKVYKPGMRTYLYLLENGFRRETIDKTLFIKKDKDDILLVQVYVDDIIFGSTKKSLCIEFEQMMHKRFQMSSMGELTFFLGLQVKQKDDGIFISQDKYVADILKKFDFATVKTTITPMETNKALLKDEEAADMDVHLYRSMIGSLMYLTASIPDIMFVVCACTRFQVTPKTSHLHVMKRIFRYLKGHPKLGLWYPRDSYRLDLGRLISQKCKKQTIVANSTTEAEYVTVANCCGQVLWIQNQLLDYGYNFMNTKIYIDNESIIYIVKNPVFHSKTKHIKIRHHFIRDSHEKRLIQVIKIHTDHNVANLLIKAFDVSRFQYLIARYLEWNGTAAKDEFQVSVVRVTYYWQVYLMLLVAFNTVVKIKNVEPIKQKKAKRTTEISQSSRPIPFVTDETIIKEWEEKMEKAVTTTSSLEVEQDNGNTNRTQSMETLNESFPQGTDSGSGPRCQDTILGVRKLKFNLRLHLNKSYDPPLLRVNTLVNKEDNMKLKELMEFGTKLSVRALDV
ncbi:putative ribonuclease H-like domain-containing protein [Tanacetum coccineum]|uniref:Ribonuclease H-like domain-containing protein n=1 Tax=Tanacetum coccineum TaxID=301880 RepID=A0ABQ5F2S0_9ASTR